VRLLPPQSFPVARVVLGEKSRKETTSEIRASIFFYVMQLAAVVCVLRERAHTCVFGNGILAH
jgi:hypothetical protein